MAYKLFSRNNCLLNFLLLLSIISCAGSPSSSSISKIPITKKGKMATAVLALVNRENTIDAGNQIHTFPDGLVFYFIIYPINSDLSPAIKQFQNFTINREPYWQNVSDTCDSLTVIFNEKTFAENEPEAFSLINIRKNSNVYIQKTIICGAPLPSEGIISYHLFFGFNNTLEEFVFSFNLKDVL